jgi:hypothetical protein
MKKIVVIILALALLAGIAIALQPKYKEEQAPESLSGQPTNFVKLGILEFPETTNRGQDTIYLSFKSFPEAPTTTMELALDAESICGGQTGSLPCMAMSISFHAVFAGKRAIVEGIEKEARLTLRRLRVLADEDPGILPEAGRVYISWMQARSLIEQCQPTLLVQTHDATVSMKLPDSSTRYAVQPVIDEVLRVVESARQSCGVIPVATE